MDVYLIAVVLYICVLLGIGVYKSRGIKTQEDFMVAGRKASTWFLVATLVVTWVGSGSLFGGAGLAFREGFSALWMSAGAWAGIVVMYFLADRVRRISQFTLSDILEQRYNATARLFGTSAIILAYLTIAGYQFRGGGRLLHILTGIDPILGGAIVCVVVILFTITAGMVSILAIDLFNGIAVTLGLIVGIPLVLASIGGMEQVATLPATRFEVTGGNSTLWVMGVFFPTFFLLLSEGSIYQKFFSAKNGGSAKKAVIGMIVGVILVETALVTLAVIGSSKYGHLAPFVGPDGAIDVAATETIILQVARFDTPLIAGVLLICAAVAIILSTANTFLMVPSTNITRDIYQRFINPSAPQDKIIRFQRIWIVILGVVAFVIANFFKSILDMAFTAYAMVGAGITPALLAVFLWKRVTVQGGVASIISGMGVTMIIAFLNGMYERPFLATEYIILPAVSASILSLVIVSLLTPPSSPDKWTPFMTQSPSREEQ